LKLLANFCTNRTFQISLGAFTSTNYSFDSACPQGSTIAPLLFMLYFNRISECIVHDYILFADDLVIYLACTTTHKIISELKVALAELLSWCTTNKLVINFSKTKWMLFSKSNNKELSIAEELTVDDVVIERVKVFKYLGVYFDPSFSFTNHFEHVINKVCSTTAWIFKIKRLINCSLFKSILHAFIISVIDYCLPIWGNMHDKYLDKLQSKINQLIIAFYQPSLLRKHGLNKQIIVNSLLDSVGILTVKERYKYHILDFTFKALKYSSSVREIREFFVFSKSSRRQLLQTITHDSRSFEKSIVFQGIKLWNALPVDLRDINLTLPAFQCKLGNLLRESRDDIYVI